MTHQLEIICCLFEANTSSEITLSSIIAAFPHLPSSTLLTIVTPLSKDDLDTPININHRFVYDPGGGYYKALNVASSALVGDKIIICNAGDVFAPSCYQEIAYMIESPYSICASSVIQCNSDGRVVGLFSPSRYPRFFIPFGMPFPHMGLIISRKYYANYQFSETIGYSADYLWLLTILWSNHYLPSEYYISKSCIGYFYGGGISTRLGFIRGLLFQNSTFFKFLKSRYSVMTSLFTSACVLPFRFLLRMLRKVNIYL